MVLVFLADGFEEVEALTTVDYLRRAGIEVKTVGVDNDLIVGSHKIKVVADITDKDISADADFEGIVLPGGMPGTLNLEASKKVNEFIDAAAKKGKLIAAICAAPSILGHKGITDGLKVTSYPGYENELIKANHTGAPTETDGNIITGRSAGTAIDFALAIIRYIKGAAAADKVKDGIKCVR